MSMALQTTNHNGALLVASNQEERRRLAKHHQRWTAAEDEMLRAAKPATALKSVAATLGRTERAVHARMLALGVARFAPFPERFWEKVEKHSGREWHGMPCWEWSASKSRGYGQFGVSGRPIGAHRIAYELLMGPVPDGLELDHLCRNRCCVNPAHLEPVPRRINLLRGESPIAQQARQTHCKNGHPFSPENTRYRADRNIRVCKECSRVYNRAAKARKRACR